MSGGVDSSTAAAVLRDAGHEVVGLTLQLWDQTETNLATGRGRCCSPADVADARAVAAQLRIPHFVFDHGIDFRAAVVQPFVDSYLSGQTPSPCITCNRRIKFGLLLRLAKALGADCLATGHYARLDFINGRPHLRKALDRDKDQSYFLFDVRRDGLQQVRFPLGELTKAQVRAQARASGLAVASKPESFELCFIADGDKDAFVESASNTAAIGSLEGKIINRQGLRLGRHQGLHRFTIGQRRGLGLGGGELRYVVDLNTDQNTVVVGPETELYATSLVAERCNWLAIQPPTTPLRAAARVRHRHIEAKAELVPFADGSVRVEFDQPQRAIAPGQGVAFYDGELLLGGGWIATRS